MTLQIAAGALFALLAVIFLLGTSTGLTILTAGAGFLVGAALILGTSGIIGSFVIGLMLLKPDVQPTLEAAAPWYVAVSLGVAVIVGVFAAMRAIRDR